MTALIRSELLALRTLRSTWAVPAVLIALVAVIVTASFADAGSPGLTTPAQLREILVATAGILCAVGMALFAATRAAGEYRHNTITHRLLASPRRTPRLTATLLVYGALGVMMASLLQPWPSPSRNRWWRPRTWNSGFSCSTWPA
jgi:hypothetical protein